MLYQIVCATPGDLKEQKVFLFDNMTNEVYDSNGRLVDFRYDERFVDFPRPNLNSNVKKNLDYSPLRKLFKNPRAKPDGTKMFCSAFLNNARMCCFFANAIVKY